MAEQRHVAIVPAAPGFSVTEVCGNPDGSGEHELFHIPIVAWAVIDDGLLRQDPWVIPVTIDSRCAAPYCAIRCPDGRTILQDDNRFAAGDDDKLLAYLVERDRREYAAEQRARTVKLAPRK